MVVIKGSVNKIYTYKDPLEINKMSIWSDIQTYPHICVSQTLVEGLKDYYGRESFKVICTMDLLLKSVYKEWYDSEEVNIEQSILISNVLDNMFEKSGEDKIVKTFGHNKKEVIKAIKFLIESDIDINSIDAKILTKEQRQLFTIYNTIKDQPVFRCLNKNLEFNDLNSAYIEILRKELEKYITKPQGSKLTETELMSLVDKELEELKKKIKGLKETNDEWLFQTTKKYKTINQIKKVYEEFIENSTLGLIENQKIFIHGVHQLAPLMLRLIKQLKNSGVEVIILFNYLNEYPEIYKTWERVYDWTGLEFIKEGKKSNNGRGIGKSIGKVYEGNLGGIYKNYSEDYFMYDNLTSFSDYVGVEYEKAAKKFNEMAQLNPNIVTNEKLMKIALMDQQFYSINGQEINKLLKVYFPEQFSNRHFLTYPIGQFILSLYYMWDDKSNSIRIKESHLMEALSLYIWEKEGMPTPIDIFTNIKYYFKGEESLSGYLSRVSNLIEMVSSDEYIRKDVLGYFVHSVGELEYFKEILEQIKKIVDNLFADSKQNIKENFDNLIKNIKFLVLNPLNEDKISDDELNMIKEIDNKLGNMEEKVEKTYIKNIKEALAFYVQASNSSQYEAEWIVRDFEQIDGGVLLAAAQKRDNKEANNEKVFHYSGLSDENLLGNARKELPWPITNKLYMEAKNDISQIYSICRSEYNNFLKYSLFYGTYFLSNNKKIIFSYIKDLEEKSAHPYSILNDILNLRAKSPSDDTNELMEVKDKWMYSYDTGERISIDYNITEQEKRSMETCFMRYLFNHCLDKGTYFIDEIQIDKITNYFISYNYIKRNRIFDESKFKQFIDKFPFLDKADCIDIQNQIINKIGQPDYNNYRDIKMEFWYRDLKKPEYNMKKDYVVCNFEEDLFGDTKVEPNLELCSNCNQRNLCVIRSLDDN